MSLAGRISGILAPRDTALDLHFETGALESYRDFINAIRDAKPDSPTRSSHCRAAFTGTGRSRASRRANFCRPCAWRSVRYNEISLDSLEGDLTYSPTN